MYLLGVQLSLVRHEYNVKFADAASGWFGKSVSVGRLAVEALPIYHAGVGAVDNYKVSRVQNHRLPYLRLHNASNMR